MSYRNTSSTLWRTCIDHINMHYLSVDDIQYSNQTRDELNHRIPHDDHDSLVLTAFLSSYSHEVLCTLSRTRDTVYSLDGSYLRGFLPHVRRTVRDRGEAGADNPGDPAISSSFACIISIFLAWLFIVIAVARVGFMGF